MNGVLLVDKPKGWTSFDVVAKVRGLIKQKTGLKRPKVGHAGTLDPLATGLLIVLVGDECKNQDKYMKLDKTYEVELKLGETSTTDDGEGEITKISDKVPTKSEVIDTINSFIGEINQVPPIFSAIKVDGKRAYKLARQGSKPEMKPRAITIHSITDIDYKYPFIAFTTSVSSGTYIRSLVRDIGENLGTAAYMTNLRRTKVGERLITDAYKINSNSSVESILSNFE
ncbi:MAG TPA: tRNA pseudouridine(55) synthase TruB [Candidatus Saccharibacteria bacterium]|nr:tRNA pseudouridine(55) synthase TruB [Candidatus Saccharibacteria bacterium]